MGDFTTEQIFITTASAGTALQAAVVVGEEEQVFEAMTMVHEDSRENVEFRGYSYDHVQHLPKLIDAFGTGAVAPLTEYINVSMLQLRQVTAKDAGAQATGILNMLAQVHKAPDRLLSLFLEDLRRIHQLTKDMSAAQTKPGSAAFSGLRADAVTKAGDAVRNFAMTTTDVLRLVDLSPVGGFFPGDDPAELTDLNQRHSPASGALIGLARGIGFLKTLVEPYEAANLQGKDIVHMQTYGA